MDTPFWLVIPTSAFVSEHFSSQLPLDLFTCLCCLFPQSVFYFDSLWSLLLSMYFISTYPYFYIPLSSFDLFLQPCVPLFFYLHIPYHTVLVFSYALYSSIGYFYNNQLLFYFVVWDFSSRFWLFSHLFISTLIHWFINLFFDLNVRLRHFKFSFQTRHSRCVV